MAPGTFRSLTIKVHIADEADLPRLGVLDAVYAHVDDRRTLFDHIGCDQPRNAFTQRIQVKSHD